MKRAVDVKELAQSVQADVVAWRRQLHQQPEASLKEYDTSAFIKEKLTRWGVTWEAVGETGVFATITGALPGDVIALRADMDALELADLKSADYASQRSGLCHACGHDAHTAALLGACRILQQHKDKIPGRVHLIFQPAEEIGAGARQFVQAGRLDGIDEIYGIHVSSDLAAGHIALTPGAQNASCDIFTIRIQGKGAHVAAPHQADDALIATAHIASALQHIVARQTDPMQSLVVALGVMRAGTRYNVVASDGCLEGTVRAFDQSLREETLRRIEETADLTARIHHCTSSFSNYDAASPLINHPRTTEKARRILEQVFGADVLHQDRRAELVAEDFADYLQQIPGTFIRVGTGSSEATRHTLHHGLFDIDESALAVMVGVHLALVLRR